MEKGSRSRRESGRRPWLARSALFGRLLADQRKKEMGVELEREQREEERVVVSSEIRAARCPT